MNDPPFKRSKCACVACQIGCRTKPGTLIPRDLKHFDLDDLWVSEGSIVVDDNGKEVPIPSLVPKQKLNHHCIFFEHGRCKVHDHSPFGCAYFDMHHKHHDRFRWGFLEVVHDQIMGGPYGQAVRELKAKKRFAPPLVERHNAFAAEELRLWRLLHADSENQG